jgi:Ca-activated chloride channel family protein
VQGGTTDHSAVAAKIGLLQTNGQTSIYDSVDYGLRALALAQYSSRAIVMITDGIDSSSDLKVWDVIDRVRKTGVPIYAVGIGDPTLRVADIGKAPFTFLGKINEIADPITLAKLAAAAGGKLFMVPQRNTDAKLSDSFAAIGQALGRGYSIGLDLRAGANADTVTVRLLKHPEATLYAHRIAPAP